MSKSWDVFRTVNEMLRFGDAKAGVILAFAGGSAAFLSSKTDTVHDIIVAHRSDFLVWVLYAAFVGYAISLVLTAVFAFRSMLPSLGGGEKRSLIFFKHICEDYKANHVKYAADIAALSETAMEEELAHQICANSSIATAKFELVSKAVVSVAWTGALWVFNIFLLLILGSAPTR